LIDLKTFDRVQARRKGTAKAPMRKNIGADFALRGFVTCAECGVPLRSSWPKGKYRNYAYYLCQTKSCNAYGKSIPRDKLEDEVGQLIKSFEPNRILLGLVCDLFKSAWQQRTQQAAHYIHSAKTQVKALEKQTEALLERIMDASNDSVINAYEAKIAKLERDKLKLQENIAIRSIPDNTLKEKLELSLQFFANLGKYGKKVKSPYVEQCSDWPSQTVLHTVEMRVLELQNYPCHSKR